MRVSTMSKDMSPFRPGDRVVYRPSTRGLSAEMMFPISQKLVPFAEYVVKEVIEDRYVVIEGHEHPGGGIYWTEFQAAGDGVSDLK
jgi:hypothetical protein